MVFLELDVGFAAFLKVFGQLFGFFPQQVVGFDDADTLHKVQHRPGEIFVLRLPFHGILECFSFHSSCDQQHYPDNHECCQADPDVEEQQEDNHDGFGEDIAHHIRQHGHAVFLDEHHVGGEHRADLADVPFGEIPHGHPPQMGAQLHAHIGEHHKPRRRLEPVGNVVKDDL